MILQSLVQYYEALLARGEIDRPGWSKVNVSWRLELNPDGSLFDISPLQKPSPNGKKLLPQQFAVPAQVKRSSGVAANFLCDTVSYLLGIDDKGKPARTKACFDASREKHLAILKDTPGEAAAAVRAFFDTWDSSSAADHPALQPYLSEIFKGGNLLFHYNNKPVTEDPDVAAAWQQAYDASSDGDVPSRCSVTGKLAPAARLHGNIQGVRGAQSSGASLVSFNADAFCSYGHEQGENAPVSTYAMTAYTQSLNYLLREKDVRRIGDVTVVCWVENADPAAATFAMSMLFGPQEQTEWTEADIRSALKSLTSGKPVDLQDMHFGPDTHFYILGLAPNAARLSVRFFWQDTFMTLAKNVNAHYERLALIRPAYEKFDMLWPYTLARSAVRFSKDWKKADEELQKSFPRLSGDLLLAILNDTRYPATLLNGTVQRIRAEHDVTWARASIIKAYYSKNEDPLFPKEVLTVSVNTESRSVPYNLGRLFAVLERAQELANPNINTTIKDRFFNSASATPSLAFPTLVNLAQKHLAKLNEGQRISLDKSIGELMSKLGETYPKQLMLAEQGAFQLGYYQQRQEYFKKKTDTTEQKEEA